MAFCKVRDILELGVRDNAAIYAFVGYSLDQIYAVVKGAEKANKPVIMMYYPNPYSIQQYPFSYFSAAVKAFAEKASVPVGLHLDHCSDINVIMEAVRSGFTSVMADGSSLPFEENVRFTNEVVRFAKVFDVDVEGELGHVGVASRTEDYVASEDGVNVGEGGISAEKLYTTAEEAKRFTELVDVTSLAVAFGSAHGVYKVTPHLSIDRLSEINAAVETPLVLHGGSGIPEDQLAAAFCHGINKINVGTEFGMLTNQLNKEAYTGACDPGRETGYVRDHLTDYIAEKVQLCKVQL